MGKAIGIDLGTTNSVMAILDKGRAKIIEIPTNDNKRLTPSVVGIYRGELLVGEAAKALKGMKPKDIIFSIKHFMGRRFRDPNVQRDIKRVPYQVTENYENGGVLVWMDEKSYSPSEISALILRALKQQAEKQIGEEVTHAVITVPAYFDRRQKDATRAAGKLAGFKTMELISEPTAAALAYGISTQSNEGQTILVYNLGRGTFDVSVLRQSRGLLIELARGGEMHFGGDDFNLTLMNHIIHETKKKHGVDLSKNRYALPRLEHHAEQAKIQVSQREVVIIKIEYIDQTHDGSPVHIHFRLTRQEYEKMIRPYIRRTIRLVERAIEQAGCIPNDIDHILLAGGSTLTPLVVKSLKKLFGTERILQTHLNPMECLALGAVMKTAI